MTLHEALNQLPKDMRLRSHLDGKAATAAEWLQQLRDESGVDISHVKRNYGKDIRVTIYFTSVGPFLSQV